VNITDGPSHQITSGLCHYAVGHMLILGREAWVGTMAARERENERERERVRERERARERKRERAREKERKRERADKRGRCHLSPPPPPLHHPPPTTAPLAQQNTRHTHGEMRDMDKEVVGGWSKEKKRARARTAGGATRGKTWQR